MIKNVSKKAALFLLIAAAVPGILCAQALDWNTVAAPKILSVAPDKENAKNIVATYDVVTGPKGASQAEVVLLDSKSKVVETQIVGRTKSSVKTIEFAPANSGKYGIRVTAKRANMPDKVSEITWFDFSYPIEAPSVSMLNNGNGSFHVRWNPIHEAENYAVSYTDLKTGKKAELPLSAKTDIVIDGLTVGNKVSVAVAAVRGKESAAAKPYVLTVRAEKDREWKFTWFGQSTSASRNIMEMIDPDNLTFKLLSCTYDPVSGATLEKGGKFTSYHDGVSFYYTEIDAASENFDLEATFTVDYINIAADGQEGFGLVVMDRLGQDGINTVNHYTNSAAILATKMEERFGETKKTSKDTLGVRFVTGITPEVLAKGDDGIAQEGESVIHAFSYDQSDLVKAGDKYRIRLVKDNSGYRTIFDKEIKSEDTITEYRLWEPEKLLQLDKEKVYVGFAAARGCNVTVSDVVMKITDPKKDPPRQEEPPQLVPITMKVDSPVTFGEAKYPFVFNVNADGKVSIADKDGKTVLKPTSVKAFTDFSKTIKLKKGFNDFVVTFKPDESYRPGPKHVIAKYNKELKIYEESYEPVSITHSVVYNTYSGKELYVSPSGIALAAGTKEDPLDIATALNYCLPGQPVYLMEGTYYPTQGIIIERGNNGRKGKYKQLLADPEAKTRPVINFSGSSQAMIIWGNWWYMKGFDVTASKGDVKGIQVGGHYNVMECIDTYENGDTGLQISGMSTETSDKWPTNNLILNCTSWGNCDPAQNNADGFAAKLTCGENNVFRGCIAYSNIDDGWDLYAKIESGPIGAVLVENCIAYKNGRRPDGTGNGDGNGFKLGGDGIAVPHVLKNSISFGNGANGITCNSNPALIVINCTSFGNEAYNITLYGKGDGERNFKVQNLLSFEGMQGDFYREQPTLAAPDNYFWNGAKALNSEGKELKANDVFKSTDFKNIVPGRKADNSIDMKGLFELTADAPAGIGADLK